MGQFHPRLDEDVIYYAAGNLSSFDHKERHYIRLSVIRYAFNAT